MKPHEINLTGILVRDQRTKGFSAYIAEIPGVVSQGKTEDEANENLFDALSLMMEVKKEEEIESIKSSNLEFKEHPLRFSLA